MRHPFTTPLKDLERFFPDPVMGEEFSAMLRMFQKQVEDGFGRVSAASNIAMALPSTFTGTMPVSSRSCFAISG